FTQTKHLSKTRTLEARGPKSSLMLVHQLIVFFEFHLSYCLIWHSQHSKLSTLRQPKAKKKRKLHPVYQTVS
ncbi:hypothetical protein LIX85_12375, partial [Legionella pneumophila]